jgi:hypothetical protein
LPVTCTLLSGRDKHRPFFLANGLIMVVTIIGIGAVILLLLGVGFAVGPVKGGRPPLVEAFFAFLAFFFLILGLRLMVGEPSPLAVVGDLFASLALTFFWVMRRK